MELTKPVQQQLTNCLIHTGSDEKVDSVHRGSLRPWTRLKLKNIQDGSSGPAIACWPCCRAYFPRYSSKLAPISWYRTDVSGKVVCQSTIQDLTSA
jgi:hypothetical protein